MNLDYLFVVAKATET